MCLREGDTPTDVFEGGGGTPTDVLEGGGGHQQMCICSLVLEGGGGSNQFVVNCIQEVWFFQFVYDTCTHVHMHMYTTWYCPCIFQFRRLPCLRHWYSGSAYHCSYCCQ